MEVAVLGGTKNVEEMGMLFQSSVEIAFFLDNNEAAAGKILNHKKIYSPYDFPRDVVDYIVILVYDFKPINQELISLGVAKEKILNFCAEEMDFRAFEDIFQTVYAEKFRLMLRIAYMERQISKLQERQKHFEQNYIYEAADILAGGEIVLPRICSVEDTCEEIISKKCSMSRYEDGEFEIILGQKAVYQKNDNNLAERLREILLTNLDNHIVALADDYGAMRQLREENKGTIRRYMTEEKRKSHYDLLNMEKQYYNAYISRPYVIYPHEEREKAEQRFRNLKRIWEDQEVLLVEGDRTRMGVGNDLFDNARQIKRIIAPNENAFDVYEEIYRASLRHGEGKLILIALGPAATVLAYDLAKEGYWAIDIGHLDLEYVWFLKGEGYSYIPHKYNNEVLGDSNVIPVTEEAYFASIVESVV